MDLALDHRSRIEDVRSFNRFYTKRIGVLNDGLLGSDFSLVEARVLFEVAHRPETTAMQLAEELLLDQGYLSRVLRGLERKGLIARHQSPNDGRQRLVTLTEQGTAAFAELNARSRDQLDAILAPVEEQNQTRLVEAMSEIRSILSDHETPRPATIVLRQHKPGDIGWCIHRHGVLYAREYGWDETFEALVAVILGEFLQKIDVERERAWIAELNGRFAGCVFLMKETDEISRLRCLLVEPDARGHGIGSRLVQECIDFARTAGYKRMVLWTNDVLHSARHIYQRAGFVLVSEEDQHNFGHDLRSQNWELQFDSQM